MIKQVLQKIMYILYKKSHSNVLAPTFAHYIYGRVLPYLTRKTRPARYRAECLPAASKKVQPPQCALKRIKIAFIVDEMTYRTFEPDCQAVCLTPANWLTMMETFQPDLLFCESAWSGAGQYKNVWRGRIYKNEKLLFENRRDLLNILDYCHRRGIRTVFWNKEDPLFWGNKYYNFVDTSQYFDYIFTTAQECLPRYKALGCKNVGLMPFGFQPKLFNPLGRSAVREERALFAGSWYNDQPERCADMKQLFEMIRKENIELRIYDRYFGTSNPVHTFPRQFQPWLYPAVPFNELKTFIQQSRYVVNINTVKNSQTMFARRVFESMACGTLVVSNESLGMRRLFGGNVWFSGEEFDRTAGEKVCIENLKTVFLHHTSKHRLYLMLRDLQINCPEDRPTVLILYKSSPERLSSCLQHYRTINYQAKHGFLWHGNLLISLEDTEKTQEVRSLLFNSNYTYVMLVTTESVPPDIKFLLTQFSYIGRNTGVGEGFPHFSYQNNKCNCNVLFDLSQLQKLLLDDSALLEKYYV